MVTAPVERVEDLPQHLKLADAPQAKGLTDVNAQGVDRGSTTLPVAVGAVGRKSRQLAARTAVLSDEAVHRGQRVGHG
jgi:hypothetical protein